MATEKRITGTTLQNLRKRWFASNPLCVKCQSKDIVRLATQLDHIKPLHKGGTNSDDNYQSLCVECHDEKSKTERGHTYKSKRTIGLDGWAI